MTADPSKPALSTTGCLLRIGVALVAVLVVIGSAAAGYFLWDQQKHRKALAAEVQAIRDAGEPLDGAELNDFYRIPNEEEDITALYIAALSPVLGTGPNPIADLRRSLADTPPHRPDVWPLLTEVEDQLRPHQRLFAALKEAGRREGSVRYPEDFTAGLTLGSTHVAAARRTKLGLQLQTLVHYHRAEFSQAADTVVAIIRLARTLQNQPTLDAWIAQTSLLSLASNLTIYLAFDKEFPETGLERIQAAFAAVEDSSCGRNYLLAERALNYTSFNLPAGVAVTTRCGVPEGTVIARDRPGDCATYFRWIRRDLEIAELPLRKALVAAAEFESEVLREQEEEKRHLHESQRCYVAKESRFPIDAHVSMFGCHETLRRVLITFCAVERHHRSKNKLPHQLDDLVPEFLAAVPLDPFTDQPLRFRSSEDQEFHLIYGLGANQRDDFAEKLRLSFPEDVGVFSFRPVDSEKTSVPMDN